MASLSYREKSLYASLAAEVVVYGSYFFLHQQNSINKVAGMLAGILLLQVLLQSLIAGLAHSRMTDERDRVIQLRGYRAGYLTLASLMLIGFSMLWFHATMGHLSLENHNMGLHFLSVFYSMLVISDITKTVTQIAAYRRAL
jgi:hypothetical protein